MCDSSVDKKHFWAWTQAKVDARKKKIINFFSEKKKLLRIMTQHELTNRTQYKGHDRNERFVVMQYIVGRIRRTLEEYMMDIATDCVVNIHIKPRGTAQQAPKDETARKATCERDANFNLFYKFYEMLDKIYPLKTKDGKKR